MQRVSLVWLISLVFLFSCGVRQEGPAVVRVAVASNFKPVLVKLSALFMERTGIPVEISAGSTGLLYAQILHGAPHEVFLAADEERPRQLAQKNLGAADSLFCYARGVLVLGAAVDRGVPQRLQALVREVPLTLAVANARLAPFGRAAEEALDAAGVALDLPGMTLLRAENVAQASHFLASGAADYAFMPLASAMDDADRILRIPAQSYRPIRQFAVLTSVGEKNPGAEQFLAFLRSDEARDVIRASGYEVEVP